MNDGRSVSRLGRRGFTLVELCIAGAAATGLAMVAVAGAKGLRGESHTAIDQMNLQTIGQAAAMYTQDNRGWLVGSPATSGRELLNDERAQVFPALDVDGDATQPFDWAGPLAWSYLAPDSKRPDRRDERFALLNGTAIPEYADPDFDPSQVDTTPAPGPLGVFADPAQNMISLPFDNNTVRPNGISGTAFQPQLASSYITSREFLWEPRAPHGPAWARSEFWGGQGTVWQTVSGAIDVQLPGMNETAGVQPVYRPRIERVGDSSQKIFLANGTRLQMSSVSHISHDVSAPAAFGGAFSDSGSWDVSFTRAWPMGTNAAGADMTRISFRRGDAENPKGNVLYFDGSANLITIDEARRPERWTPRGALVSRNRIWEEIREEYDQDMPSLFGFGIGFTRMP